ncbi:MAG: pyridoxamine 5'-phosphate oxidase family protein [Rhodospirillaceae bacterium]|nr:pyridoxamine 5'-phosphate oxidase family protein [Rhodospirillaceae bacterium]
MTISLEDIPADSRITSLERLDALYGEPSKRALIKEIDHISAEYQVFVEKSPFVILASSGPGGLDCSPRGDPAGFVRVLDEKTVLLPDRLGNNRTDSLSNIITDPRVSLLFLIPGVGETLRINGHAEIFVDANLCAEFIVNGKTPRSVLAVHVERVYFQCPKALIRSKLWDLETQVARAELPSSGDIYKAITDGEFGGAEYDRAYPEHIKETIY